MTENAPLEAGALLADEAGEGLHEGLDAFDGAGCGIGHFVDDIFDLAPGALDGLLRFFAEVLGLLPEVFCGILR